MPGPDVGPEPHSLRPEPVRSWIGEDATTPTSSNRELAGADAASQQPHVTRGGGHSSQQYPARTMKSERCPLPMGAEKRDYRRSGSSLSRSGHFSGIPTYRSQAFVETPSVPANPQGGRYTSSWLHSYAQLPTTPFHAPGATETLDLPPE